MFGATRDPFAFIRNGIRLDSGDEDGAMDGRIRFIRRRNGWRERERERETWKRSAPTDGWSTVRGGQRIPVDGLKYGDGTKGREPLSTLKRNIGREGRKAVLLLEEASGEEREGGGGMKEGVNIDSGPVLSSTRTRENFLLVRSSDEFVIIVPPR